MNNKSVIVVAAALAALGSTACTDLAARGPGRRAA